MAGVPLQRIKIQEYVSCGLKPKKLLEKLRDQNLPIPKYGFLCNYIKYNIKSDVFKMPTISFNSETIPDNDDEPFVVNFFTHYEDEELDDDEDVTNGTNDEDFYEKNYYRFIVTSKRLLRIAARSKIIHADATYKLIWKGYPVLIVGTTDGNRKFHSFGLAVCTWEKQQDFEFIFQSIIIGLEKLNLPVIQPQVLVADGSDVIRNVFVTVFKCSKMVMCWAHMLRACKKHMNNMSKEFKEDLIDDNKTLQLAQIKEFFEAASKLFINKYEQNCTNFLDLGFYRLVKNLYEWVYLWPSVWQTVTAMCEKLIYLHRFDLIQKK